MVKEIRTPLEGGASNDNEEAKCQGAASKHAIIDKRSNGGACP